MKEPPSTSSGSPELFFDPDRFSAAVAGVARAADQIGSAQQQVDPAAGPAADFGAVAGAWSAFHQAWAPRVDLATKAADQLASLLPVAAHAITSADAASGTISVHTSITPIVGPVNGKK